MATTEYIHNEQISEIRYRLEAQSKCEPKQRGRYLRVSSPFRAESDSDSFSFDLETGGGKDFFDGTGYNLQQIAKQLRLDWQPGKAYLEPRRAKPTPRLSDSDAWQAWAAGFVKRSQRLLARNLKQQHWLSARGIDGDYGLGWNPKYIEAAVGRQKVSAGRGLVIPHFENGRIVAVRIRVGPGKYVHVTGGRGDRLYRGDTITAGATVAIVESELDALCLQTQCPDIVAVATGGTSGGRGAVDRLKLASKVYVAFDADEAGDIAAAWWPGKRARPSSKDICAMYEAGSDLGAWLTAASAFEMPDSWRIAMLNNLTASEAGISEGVVRIWQQHGALPDTRVELLFNLGKVGFQFPARTVERYMASGLFHSDFDTFIAKLAFEIARRAGRRQYEKDTFAGRLTACRSILRSLGPGGGADTTAAAKKRRKVRATLSAGGESSPLDLSYFDGVIKNGADYRAAVMRALYERIGERSRAVWGRDLGVNKEQVKATAKRCKLKLVEREQVKTEVKTMSDCFAAQADYPKSKILYVQRSIEQGGIENISFSKSMSIQQGDKVVIQPISEHLELDENPVSPKPRPTTAKKSNLGLGFGELALRGSNMARPDGKWRGKEWDPKWIYWQHLFVLEENGWEVDTERLLIVYKATGEVEADPDLDKLKAIIANDFKPLADPLLELVSFAMKELGAVLDG